MTDQKDNKTSTLTLKIKTSKSSNTTPRSRNRSGARARRVEQKAPVNTQTERDDSKTIKQKSTDFNPKQHDKTAFKKSASSTQQTERKEPRHLAKQNKKERIHRKPQDKTSFGFLEEFNFHAFATCPKGLEQVLANELLNLGFKNVNAGHSGCFFKTNLEGIMRANLYSRIATRILLQLKRAICNNEQAIYDFASQVKWEQWFGPSHTLRVDTSAIKSPLKSLNFCNLRVKDAICDRLREKEGARPSIDTVRPDAKVQLFLFENQATLYLDTSGESLFKRGWRFSKGEAPLRENLAAGILALSGWKTHQPLLDPFCGSGTLLIEAAWKAKNIPSGYLRPFQFQRLRSYNETTWLKIKNQAEADIQWDKTVELWGTDLDSTAIESCYENLQRAMLQPQDITFIQKSALQIEVKASAPGWIITNPPYGQRLEDDTFLYPWSTHLKNHYDQWQVAVISSNLNLDREMRLKAKKRTPLFNGNLECRLFMFDITSRQYRE